MAGENEGVFISEWAGQIPFDSVFHNLSYQCRNHQINGEVVLWYQKLAALQVHADNVFTDGEREELEKEFKIITEEINRYTKIPFSKIAPSRTAGMYALLYNFERKFRQYYNAHVPFLKQKPTRRIK